MVKRIIALLLALTILVLFCSCTSLSAANTISYNDDGTELYYNGRTYINYENYNGKYRIDLEKDTDKWAEIATMPYGIFYILGAVTVYYGNNTDNPEIITDSRANGFYVREDISIDHSYMLSVRDTATPFSFRISDVTTGNSIAYDTEKKDEFKSLCNFYATFEDYPGVQLWIEIHERNGAFYIQDAWDSDYYEITDGFREDLSRFGIDTFNYRRYSKVE